MNGGCKVIHQNWQTQLDNCSVLQALYLSKNFLHSLGAVVQFRALAKLSAADNRLADLEVLDALLPLAGTLTAANFEGNPLSRLPHYRAHVGFPPCRPSAQRVAHGRPLRTPNPQLRR